jgi:TM2 domain-containing membrane protein YozV
MVLGRVVTACAALALVTSASDARGGDFVIGMGGRGEDESRNSADEPAIASAHAGPQATADFHSCPGDGLANMAVRGVSQAAPGSRTGALFRSMLVPGYGQLYNGQRFKGGLLFSTEIALLSAALAFHLAGDSVLSAYNRETRLQLSGDPTGRAQQLYAGAQARYRVRDGLLLAATGMWVLNMADAYLSGGRGRPLLAAGGVMGNGRELAPLAAIRPGHAIFGLQGRF